jgi:hypothetical protein
MTGNGIADQFGNDLVVTTLRQLRGDRRPGRRMIDALARAIEAGLEVTCLFSEIVQQSGKSRRSGNSDRLTELLGEARRAGKVLVQPLPGLAGRVRS